MSEGAQMSSEETRAAASEEDGVHSESSDLAPKIDIDTLREMRAKITELRLRTQQQWEILNGVRSLQTTVATEEVQEMREQLVRLRSQVESRTSELQRLRQRCIDVSTLSASVNRVIETRAVLMEAERALQARSAEVIQREVWNYLFTRC